MEILQMDWHLVMSHSAHLMIAYLLAFPIGWDREQSKRHFGLRTDEHIEAFPPAAVRLFTLS